MKKVKMFVVAALVMGIGQVASAQHAGHSGHTGHASHGVHATHAGQGGASAQDSQQMSHDQLRIAVQKICPVTGEKLGSMGDPVKARIGQEEVFLCCDGCLSAKVNKDHWATIHANVAKAQAKCPVMNRALPNSAQWTIVEGQIVYVCCPPCTNKIEADPKTHLQKVDALYAASIRESQRNLDKKN